MPIVSPQSNGMPNDWRWAFDKFKILKDLGSQVGEPTGSWRLEFPSRAKRIVDKSWTMTYSWQGNYYNNVFVGTNGRESAQAIAKIIPIYADLVRRRKVILNQGKGTKTKKPNPMFDNEKNREWRDRFNKEIKGVRDSRTHSLFEQYNAHLLKYMKRQAGFLAMTIQEYWFSHPHSNLFPAPPWNQEEFDRRQKVLEATVRDKEHASQLQKEAGTYNPNYIPPV